MAQDHEEPFLDDPETMEEEALKAEEMADLEPPTIEDVEAENAQLKDRLMRAMAETENMRKRAWRRAVVSNSDEEGNHSSAATTSICRMLGSIAT